MEEITTPASGAQLTDRVLALVARYYEIAEPHTIIGRSRNNRLTAARHMAAWVLRQADKLLSLPELGRLLGGRDHTTILHSLRRAEELRAEDEHFRTYTDVVVAELERQKALRLAALPTTWPSFEADIHGAARAATAAMRELRGGSYDRDAA